MGKVAEIGKAASHSLEFTGQELKLGDRVVMCPDILCGGCWYCRNTFGFPLCQNIKGYGNAFTCDKGPHLMGGWADYIYVRKDAFVFKVSEDMEPRIAVISELMTCTFNLDKAKELYTMGGEGFGSGATIVVQGGTPRPPACAQSPAHGRRDDHCNRPFRTQTSTGEGFRRRYMSSA